MWSSAEITKANSEEITELLTTQQAVLTESYIGPDAQALDRSIVVVCGRDAPDEELLRLRYQAFGIWSATKSLAPSTFGTYLNCLHTGWMACIDARNRKSENINYPWDYAAHPLEKVTTILCDYIVPKLIANKAATELLSNFGTHISAIDMLRQSQLGIPHVKQELRAHPIIKAAMEELRAAKQKAGQ